MNNKTLLLTLSFTLGTLFTNAQSLPGFQWGVLTFRGLPK